MGCVKMQDMKMQDVRMKDQVARQENAGHENARHKTLLGNSSEMRLMFKLQPSLLNSILTSGSIIMLKTQTSLISKKTDNNTEILLIY